MTRVKPGRQIVLEVPGEGMFRIYTGGKGKPSVYRLVGKGSVERRVNDEATLQKVAKSFRGYVDEHRAQRTRWTYRASRWLRTWPREAWQWLRVTAIIVAQEVGATIREARRGR